MKKAFYDKLSLSMALLMSLIFLISASSCNKRLLDSNRPVTLTMWHNYGGQMKNLMDEMIDEFNSTIGAEKGIIINVTAISGSQELHDMLTAAAEDIPGSMPLPDITTAYPKTAIILKQHERLADLSEYFNEKMLEEYVPAFVEEGRLGSDGLYVFPIAKSTEVMFVNQTLFDRFAAENDIGYEDLATYEGITQASLTYLKWTDSKTPDIPGDGKSFFMPDSLFNQAMVGSRQMGDSLLTGDFKDEPGQNAELNLSSPSYSRIWNSYYTAAVCGGFAAFDGYSSDLFKTGDLVCSVGSTAGVLFYPDTVTYPDNTKEEAKYAILPYPYFVGGEKTALQRGGGMCVLSPEEANKYAASIFLEWFTSPSQNLRFTLSSGYLPVTKDAFSQLTNVVSSGSASTSAGSSTNISIENERIAQQLKTVLVMYDEYDFFYAPPAANYEELQRLYEEQLLDKVLADRQLVAAEIGLESESCFSYDAVEVAGSNVDAARQEMIDSIKRASP